MTFVASIIVGATLLIGVAAVLVPIVGARYERTDKTGRYRSW